MSGIPPEQNAALDALIAECQADTAAPQSPWEPACIASTFASKSSLELLLAFTMQTWIDLDAVRSPLLLGQEFATAGEFGAALAAFGHPGAIQFEAEEAAVLTDEMQQAIALGFSTRLGMRQSGEERGDATEHGFGEWLPLYTFLIAECGISRDDARACPVGEAFALASARRHLQGWQCAGTPYALREKSEGGRMKEESDG